MAPLLLKRASASRSSGKWADDDYDVLADGVVVGRIFNSAALPGLPWMWTLIFGHHEDRSPTHGYAATREDAMAAFAKSCSQRRNRGAQALPGADAVRVICTMTRKMLPFILALVLIFASCAPDGAAVDEAQYAAKIVGDWQGTVADVNETISFSADGRFMSRVRPRGFISNTLSQGTTGTIRGTWTIKGNVISLNIDSAEDANVVNKTATSTIEMFKQNELVVRSSRGETSTFMRM
jgi:hypothetical protein